MSRRRRRTTTQQETAETLPESKKVPSFFERNVSISELFFVAIFTFVIMSTTLYYGFQTLSQEISSLKTEIVTGVSSVQSQLEVLNSEVSFVKSDVSSVKSEVSSVKSEVSSVQSQLEVLNSEVSFVKSDVSSVKSEVSSVQSQLQVLGFEVGSIKSEFNIMKDQIQENNIKFNEFIELVHDFATDRVEFLKSISYPYLCNQSMTTAFGFHYENRTFGLTVSHMRCNETVDLFPCDGIDVSIINQCPPTPSSQVINGTEVARIREGDEVVVFGLNSFTSSYTGRIGGLFGKNETSFPPFNDQSNIPPDSHVITGATQEHGLSGSAVLNGYGLLGLAVGRGNDKTALGGNVAFVIPIKHVHECIRGKINSITTECIEHQIVSPPKLR